MRPHSFGSSPSCGRNDRWSMTELPPDGARAPAPLPSTPSSTPSTNRPCMLCRVVSFLARYKPINHVLSAGTRSSRATWSYRHEPRPPRLEHDTRVHLHQRCACRTRGALPPSPDSPGRSRPRLYPPVAGRMPLFLSGQVSQTAPSAPKSACLSAGGRPWRVESKGARRKTLHTRFRCVAILAIRDWSSIGWVQ